MTELKLDDPQKEQVRAFWEVNTCGARYGEGISDRVKFFDEIERTRYEQDYMLRDFAQFERAGGKRVLEVGLGTGTDFVQWARAGADVHGVDLTEASVNYVQERLALYRLKGTVTVGDAEALNYPDEYFDIFYSWGVLHHTPNIERAIAEAYRVLKPGGEFRIMLYHYSSVGTFLLWLLYGPLRGRWKTARAAVAENMESPGTMVLTRAEAESLVRKYFRNHPVTIKTYLSSADLLTHRPSNKYSSPLWQVLLRVYPRWFIRTFLGHRFGTFMTISTVK